MIVDRVKLVIWDLDDTFWRGTLAEEEIQPVPGNIELVKELARRGIISSICSKNNFDLAKNKLIALGVYEYFVFPSISFNPKGRSVAEIVEGAGLRAQNTLFIDDNALNREEVKFFNPGIMVEDPAEVLAGLLDHPNMAGKSDPDMSRLKQYQFLQRRFEEKKSSTVSNEEFLRISNIRVTIDYDIDVHFDRIVELINRTNQLNYTKQRLDTAEDIAAFRNLIGTFGMLGGCVFATDNYGDYGLIGFFLVYRRAGTRKLLHFVFSCRTMNMGIEQYVYEQLDTPDITVVEPVSYGLRMHATIDWISDAATHEGDTLGPAGRKGKVVLLGGCELLQVASYCGVNRLEFVNKIADGIKVRYEDPGFILSERNALKRCESMRAIPYWTYEDAVQFDEAVTSSETILISLWPALIGKYFRTKAGVLVRLGGATKRTIKRKMPQWFGEVESLSLDVEERLDLVRASFDAIAGAAPASGKIFVLSCATRGMELEHTKKKGFSFNRACEDYCKAHVGKMFYVDLDSVVPAEAVSSKTHYSRQGYLLLARSILDLAESASLPSQSSDAA
jgi:FkbH-like protein